LVAQIAEPGFAVGYGEVGQFAFVLNEFAAVNYPITVTSAYGGTGTPTFSGDSYVRVKLTSGLTTDIKVNECYAVVGVLSTNTRSPFPIITHISF
jgi:hypothetical protein